MHPLEELGGFDPEDEADGFFALLSRAAAGALVHLAYSCHLEGLARAQQIQGNAGSWRFPCGPRMARHFQTPKRLKMKPSKSRPDWKLR